MYVCIHTHTDIVGGERRKYGRRDYRRQLGYKPDSATFCLWFRETHFLLSLSLLSKGKVTSEALLGQPREACACSKVNSTLPALPFSLELVRSPRVLRTPDGMAVLFWLVFLGQGRLEQGIYNFEGTSLVATCCPSEVSREQWAPSQGGAKASSRACSTRGGVPAPCCPSPAGAFPCSLPGLLCSPFPDTSLFLPDVKAQLVPASVPKCPPCSLALKSGGDSRNRQDRTGSRQGTSLQDSGGTKTMTWTRDI